MRRATVVVVAVLGIMSLPGVAAGQSLGAAERDALTRLSASRGATPQDIQALLAPVDDAAAKGLPTEPLTSKIREGFAKGVAPARIPPVVRRMAGDLQMAEVVLREHREASTGPERAAAITLLAEAFHGGVMPDEVRDLARQVGQVGQPFGGISLASAAKALALLSEARLPPATRVALAVEAARQGYQPIDLIDLGREVKRREATYRHEAALGALSAAIARGERPERIFRDVPTRPEPTTVRPERTSDRTDRPDRPDAPARVDRPERPQRPQDAGPPR